MVILVSEASNRYMHLFLVEREYFGFNAPDSVQGRIQDFKLGGPPRQWFLDFSLKAGWRG
jgi:hypothetical protein